MERATRHEGLRSWVHKLPSRIAIRRWPRHELDQAKPAVCYRVADTSFFFLDVWLSRKMKSWQKQNLNVLLVFHSLDESGGTWYAECCAKSRYTVRERVEHSMTRVLAGARCVLREVEMHAVRRVRKRTPQSQSSTLTAAWARRGILTGTSRCLLLTSLE